MRNGWAQRYKNPLALAKVHHVNFEGERNDEREATIAIVAMEREPKRLDSWV